MDREFKVNTFLRWLNWPYPELPKKIGLHIPKIYSMYVHQEVKKILEELRHTRVERNIAQENFEYYFKKYLQASGKTVQEAEQEWSERHAKTR